MSLSAIIDALIASGGTLEQVAAVVRAHEAKADQDDELRREKSRANNAERQRRKRENDRARNVSHAVTPVTERDRRDGPSPDKESPQTPKEITLIQDNPSPPEGGSAPTPIAPLTAANRRGTRLPPDWQPSPEEIAFARGEGMSLEAIQREAAKFRDYWAAKAGAGGAKLDWVATWRNWIRNNHHPRQDRRNERSNDIASAFDRLEACIHGGADHAPVSPERGDGPAGSRRMPDIAGGLF